MISDPTPSPQSGHPEPRRGAPGLLGAAVGLGSASVELWRWYEILAVLSVWSILIRLWGALDT